MSEDVKSRYRIPISYGALSASFTRDMITILEAGELGLKMSKLLFEIVETKDVVISLEVLARYKEPLK